CPQANQEKSNPGNALEKAGGQEIRELAADQDSEQTRKGEGPGRGDKYPEAAQAWICREEQRRYLGFVAEFRQEDGYKNGPQSYHDLPLLLKTRPNASTRADAGGWEADEFFVVGIKEDERQPQLPIPSPDAPPSRILSQPLLCDALP